MPEPQRIDPGFCQCGCGAVEALKDALGLIDRMADESQCVLHDEIEAEEERLQQALSEIEQGDAK